MKSVTFDRFLWDTRPGIYQDRSSPSIKNFFEFFSLLKSFEYYFLQQKLAYIYQGLPNCELTCSLPNSANSSNCLNSANSSYCANGEQWEWFVFIKSSNKPNSAITCSVNPVKGIRVAEKGSWKKRSWKVWSEVEKSGWSRKVGSSRNRTIPTKADGPEGWK